MAGDSETILGLKVVSHNETSSGKYGGPLLKSPDFAAQFKDLPFDKVDSDVDMVAGSTAKITLTGVKNCVNKVVDFHRVEILKQEVDLGVLSVRYEEGHGVTKDIYKAGYWLVKAFKAGDKESLDDLKRLELCTNCGGTFTGTLIKKCSKCRANKDY